MQNGGQLLAYASSVLNPDVFLHPVWHYFGEISQYPSKKLIKDLRDIARSLLNDEPCNACRVLFICAVCQGNAGLYKDSVETIQIAFSTAEKHDLTKEMTWAKWGAGAIYIQQGNYKKASKHLDDLQAILKNQDEWVLADFVEVLNQSLQRIEITKKDKSSEASASYPPGDMLSVSLDWLQHWGSPKFCFELNPNMIFEQKNRFSNLVLAKIGLFSLLRHGQDGFVRILTSLFHILKIRRMDKGIRNPVRTGLDAGISQITVKNIRTLSISQSSFQSSEYESSAAKASTDKIITPEKTNRRKAQKSISVNAFIQMLGPFNIIFQKSHLKLPNSHGLSILKYLLIHHNQSTPREILMDTFWPESNPESARNSLNVALYSLRRSLRSVTKLELIHFENGTYQIGPNIDLWLDVEEFEHCVEQGQGLEVQHKFTEAVAEYEIAVNLYRGDFLAENLYEGWTVLERERLRINYLDTLDHLSQIYFNQNRYGPCATLCQLILNRDLCREDAHSRLMRCYCRLGQGPLALRQYQICAEALRSELAIDPAPETILLYEQIRHHEDV